MKQHQGIWLPDHEEHMVEWMTKNGEIVDGRGTYQIKKLRASLEHVKAWRVAVDVGSHVGFWSMQLAKRFQQIYAFEPVAAHRECFLENMASSKCTVALHHVALGNEDKMVYMTIPAGSSGGTHVEHRNLDHVKWEDQVAMHRLDAYGLKDVDYLKIDCEGYELDVVRGAEEMLRRCRPCVIVEQKPHIMGKNYPGEARATGTPAVDFLRSLGAVERKVISGDHILSWD